MINKKLINPESIVVVGGSNNVKSPGGKVLKNIIDGNFTGRLYVVNPKQSTVQGIKCYQNIKDIPNTDTAIIAIPAKFCPQTVKILTEEKKTKGFIILSAGFSEQNGKGKQYEKEITKLIDDAGGSLIGPNCIGLMNPNFTGVFTTPIPKLAPDGVDFISGSGSTAVFIMESAIPNGVTFSGVFSVGNSAQIGVEEVLEYFDESFDPVNSPKVKILYIESIKKPHKLLKHASSLIKKGCKIAAIKAGSSEAGSRAASSHTGALANLDTAVDALFKKAGIVRCYSRSELAAVASVFLHPELKGKNIAIITHAGGPAVMLTDILTNNGLNVPEIDKNKGSELAKHLFSGSSVANPIDFLATGTAEQLGQIIDFCDNLEEIDAMVVIFGSPGLTDVYDVYDILDKKMNESTKPIYPVLPSIINAQNEIEQFLSKGRINFPDEVVLGNALAKVFNTPLPYYENSKISKTLSNNIKSIIKNNPKGYLPPQQVQKLLKAIGIPTVKETIVKDKNDAVAEAKRLGFPIVMKVTGPIHKSDAGGVVLNITDMDSVENEFENLINIKGATGVLMQPMLSGRELFIGAKREDNFGHIILTGLGGIFVEILNDVSSALAPISKNEALNMIRNLKSYKIIKGSRGQSGINEDKYADIIQKISMLIEIVPEISELDLNPLIGTGNNIVCVDARINFD